MNIYLREMKANTKSLIIWCVAQVFIILAGMMKYVGFAESGIDIEAMFSSYPEALLNAFGISDVDISSVDGFYTVFFLYFMLLAAIHAVMFGAVIISKEERDHSADFLFSKPVKRHKVVISKALAGVTNILIFNLVTLITSVLMIAQNNDGDGLFGQVSMLMLALFLIQLMFLCIGLLLGAWLKSTKLATSVATSIVLGTFFLSILSDISEKVNWLKYFTPFKAFNSSTVMLDGEFSLISTTILLAVAAACILVTLIKFKERDLNT